MADNKLTDAGVGIERFKAEVRAAFSAYVRSEGCSCCESESHGKEDSDRIGQLLGFSRYDDDSGWNFYDLPQGKE